MRTDYRSIYFAEYDPAWDEPMDVGAECPICWGPLDIDGGCELCSTRVLLHRADDREDADDEDGASNALVLARMLATGLLAIGFWSGNPTLALVGALIFAVTLHTPHAKPKGWWPDEP